MGRRLSLCRSGGFGRAGPAGGGDNLDQFRSVRFGATKSSDMVSHVGLTRAVGYSGEFVTCRVIEGRK